MGNTILEFTLYAQLNTARRLLRLLQFSGMLLFFDYTLGLRDNVVQIGVFEVVAKALDMKPRDDLEHLKKIRPCCLALTQGSKTLVGFCDSLHLPPFKTRLVVEIMFLWILVRLDSVLASPEDASEFTGYIETKIKPKIDYTEAKIVPEIEAPDTQTLGSLYPDEEFSEKDDAVAWVKGMGMANGMIINVVSSKRKNGVLMRCCKGGKVSVDGEYYVTSDSKTQITGCKFKLYVHLVDGKWRIRVYPGEFGIHNHELFDEDHPTKGLSDGVKQLIQGMSKDGCRPVRSWLRLRGYFLMKKLTDGESTISGRNCVVRGSQSWVTRVPWMSRRRHYRWPSIIVTSS
ncbi:OLC1v1030581C1 [Oldenlandia corymbosa var. corymbosa]|uniref:OLC1v1030581C1 n=1 Tax=Oldenlandia corymbosa var. corymbosa TaxID=529605 RepID=A0AAV1CH64_OLDCO|nr:OLC1v1030581C1 [Oldenlandia corymbosa var. corymbosa]